MNPDDDGSNVTDDPKADGHLPVSGEFDAHNIPTDNPLTTDANDDDTDGTGPDDLAADSSNTNGTHTDPNDTTAISAQNTDQTNADTAATPEAPAAPQDEV